MFYLCAVEMEKFNILRENYKEKVGSFYVKHLPHKMLYFGSLVMI